MCDCELPHSAMPPYSLLVFPLPADFPRVEKPRSPICIPFQLSRYHLIPITLIIAVRDASRGREMAHKD